MRNIFLFLLLISGISFAQSKTDCTRLKNCKLESFELDDESVMIIKNNDLSQIYDDGNFIKSKINWISECEAEITISEVSIPDFPLKVGEKMNLKFAKIENDVVDFSVVIQGQKHSSKFKIIK